MEFVITEIKFYYEDSDSEYIVMNINKNPEKYRPLNDFIVKMSMNMIKY